MSKLMAYIVWFVFCLSVTVFPGICGLILLFKSSLLLGLVGLIFFPASTAFGWIAIFGHPELAHFVASYLHLTF